MSPTPFHCHTCDKPTINSSGVCDSCLEKQQVSVYLNSFNKIPKPKRTYQCPDCGAYHNDDKEYYCFDCRNQPSHYEETEDLFY